MSPSIPHRPTASQAMPPAPSQAETADASDFAEFIADQDPLDVAAAGWMVRRQDGLTPQEEAELQAWLAADPAHAKALGQVEGVWGRMDEFPDEGVEALKAGLQAEEAGISQSSPKVAPVPAPVQPKPSPRPSQPESRGRRAWFLDLGRLVPQAAAAAIALSVVGGGWYGWNAWQHQPTFSTSLATVRGQQKDVKLPDGSTLWLDTATRVDVALYRQRREVRLSEGQVFFAVQSNSAQPFEVLAGSTRITVVGTRFSVRRTRSGLEDDDSVSVVVEEGRVRVARDRGAPNEMAETEAVPAGAVELGAGQSVVADATGALAPVRSEAAAPASWREGRLNFNGTPLDKALAEFERYGNTGLVIRDPAVAALKVNGSFDLRQVSAFIQALPQVLPVRVRRVEGHMEIVAARNGG